MPKSVADWSKQICTALNNIDPQMSTEIGDPIRKVIDAVASVASAVEMNAQVNQSFFDLDSKSGADLDAIASWLGFGRRDGIKAVGEVRFFVDEPATLNIQIPAGTQVTDGNVVFETLSSTVLAQFDTEVFARILCTTVGTSGNVNAYAINQVVTTVSNVELHVENRNNTVNGVDVESDAELRQRIRQTFLRNVAGTEDAYRGVSDKVNGTNRVNVIGPIERWEEQMEVVDLSDDLGGGVGFQSMIPCSKYTWPRQTYLVREPGTDNEMVYREGTDYIVDRSYDPAHPVVKILMTDDMLHLDGLSGSQLDKVGETLGLPRYGGTPAYGTVSFGFDIAQKSNYTIKKGARVRTPSGDILVTQHDTTIYSGSLGSSDVDVLSQEYKPISVPNGTHLTYIDRTGFDVMVVEAITGGERAWDDATYREKIRERFYERVSISPGDFLFFKHEYCSNVSRNEPTENPPKVNKVDVFVDGIDVQEIREVSQIQSVTLNDDPDDMWYVGNFYYEDGTHPIKGTKMEVLGYNPVVSIPESVNINGGTYYLGKHYRLVRNQTLTAGSTREIAGMAWIPGQELPSDGSFTEMRYDYNRTVMVTDALLDTNRQICTDVLCHEAHRVGLTINVIVQSVLGQSDSTLLESINHHLDDWAKNTPFGQWIQRSDLEMTIRQAIGVDACRIATPDDTWRTINLGDDVGQKVKSGIQTHETFRHYLDEQHDEDFRLWDSMLPTIYKVNIVRTAANTYDPSYRPEP